MAGLKVVAVACDDDGNIDQQDLAARAAEHADRLAALMVTYPSTHGVFETGIRIPVSWCIATAVRCTSMAPTSCAGGSVPSSRC